LKIVIRQTLDENLAFFFENQQISPEQSGLPSEALA
jgi:hypothetical protein